MGKIVCFWAGAASVVIAVAIIYWPITVYLLLSFTGAR
jgi:hypothetical protein